MFGDAYIRLRAQVGTALYSLARLAEECDAPVETRAELQELQDALREPFLFVTLGEGEAGKSSLLNALFARDFTDAPARTEKLTVYRYAAEAKDVELGDATIERMRPHLFLRDFALVDSPAIALRAEVTPELWPYVAVADLLLFVFSAARPEADRTWTLLSRLDPARLQRVVFVVDTSGSDVSLDEAAKRLRQSMLKRLGQARPIFPIDTRGALAAHIIGDRAALAVSGLDKLEQYIDREVAEGITRRAPVDLARGRARELLKQITAVSREAVQSSSRDGKLLSGMHRLIEERKDQSLRQMGGILWSLANTLEAAQEHGEASFRQHLSLFGLLRATGRWRDDLERNVEMKLRDTVWTEIDAALQDIEIDQRSAWEQLETQRRRAMTELPAPQPPEFRVIRERLRDDFDTVLARHSLDAGTDRHLHAKFFLAGATMRMGLYAIAVGALLTGFSMVAEPAPFGKVLAGTAAIVVLTFLALALWQWRLLAAFRRFSTARREALVREVDDHLRAAIEHFGEDLADSLGPVEVACAARRRAHEPLFARAQQLDELFAKAKAPPATTAAQDHAATDSEFANAR
jgi:hypothetical protein